MSERRFSPEWWAERVEPEPNTGCHIWLGTVCRLGYGRVGMKGRSPVLVHRVAYECAYGPYDASLKVCHRCDNPSCVNPDHLFLGTQRDNMHDMFRKGRARPRGATQPKRPNAWRHCHHSQVSKALAQYILDEHA